MPADEADDLTENARILCKKTSELSEPKSNISRVNMIIEGTSTNLTKVCRRGKKQMISTQKRPPRIRMIPLIDIQNRLLEQKEQDNSYCV